MFTLSPTSRPMYDAEERPPISDANERPYNVDVHHKLSKECPILKQHLVSSAFKRCVLLFLALTHVMQMGCISSHVFLCRSLGVIIRGVCSIINHKEFQPSRLWYINVVRYRSFTHIQGYFAGTGLITYKYQCKFLGVYKLVNAKTIHSNYSINKNYPTCIFVWHKFSCWYVKRIFHEIACIVIS